MVTLRPRKISNAYYYTLTCILGASASLVATTFILGNWLMLTAQVLSTNALFRRYNTKAAKMSKKGSEGKNRK